MECNNTFAMGCNGKETVESETWVQILASFFTSCMPLTCLSFSFFICKIVIIIILFSDNIMKIRDDI